MIQCAKESHEKRLLQMKTFFGLKCSVTPHSSLSTSKGIACCPALSRVTNDDIKEGMAEQGVTDVRRITVHRDYYDQGVFCLQHFLESKLMILWDGSYIYRLLIICRWLLYLLSLKKHGDDWTTAATKFEQDWK